jgi:hypothetical protein
VDGEGFLGGDVLWAVRVVLFIRVKVTSIKSRFDVRSLRFEV